MEETRTLELPVADDYVPSEGELDNFVYLCCKYGGNWGMRRTDLAICLLMAGGCESIVGNAGLTRLCEVTCEYLWDHICGEPEEVSPDDIFDHLKPLLKTFYEGTTVADRSNTE